MSRASSKRAWIKRRARYGSDGLSGRGERSIAKANRRR